MKALLILAGLVTGAIGNAAGDLFILDLEANAGKGAESARAAGNQSPPPELRVKSGDNLNVRWSVKNIGKVSVPDVTLHLSLTKAGAEAAYESALVMDFDTGSAGSGEILVQVPEAGSYLLKLETIGAAGKLGREYLATIGVKGT